MTFLPKQNHIETPQDSSSDCDEHTLEDPIEVSHVDEILKECDELLITYISDEILEEPSRENPIEPCPEIVEHLENPVFTILDDEISEKIETFEGEPIYDSFSDECSIIDNDEGSVRDPWEPLLDDSLHIFDQPCISIDNTDFEPPSWDDCQSCPISPMVDDLDCFNLPCTSSHSETFQPSDPPCLMTILVKIQLHFTLLRMRFVRGILAIFKTALILFLLLLHPILCMRWRSLLLLPLYLIIMISFLPLILFAMMIYMSALSTSG